jgi:formate dehydrogenase major subunit
MTNHWIDMTNADVVMICGSNAAENHPLGTRWIRATKERGAIVLCVDPRYTRTAAFADVYCKFRSGTDIALVNGMIHYALQNDRIQWEYVRHYTNATFLIDPKFDFHDGLFTGYDAGKRAYDPSFWAYELDASGVPKRDLTMQHPRCVMQLMKKFFARYDVQTVCDITGAPVEDYRKVCDIYTSTWAPDRVGTWLYAMGTTQHSHGTQNIRSYTILQLLLGNIGMAGGGVNALRGESNVQGSTDMGLLFHVLPGYLRAPAKGMDTLDDYLKTVTPKSNDPMSANWWQNYPKYLVSMLKAYWGDHATPANDFAYGYLPKTSGNHSFIALFEAMHAGKMQGLFCFGQNPAVGGPNSNKERDALAKLEWLVCADLFETDTSVFWKRPGADPAAIQTEVFLLPAAASMEKEGSVVNSGRWVQWRYKAVDPPGVARTDSWILSQLVRGMKQAYAAGGAFPDPILHLTWDYGERAEPDIARVSREMNGRFLRDLTIDDKSFQAGKQVPTFALLQSDGSTACGCWIYCGSHTEAGNMMARRVKDDAINRIGLFPKWAWAWPVNRRILYNRASVDAEGRPWDPKRWVIRWNAALNDGKGGWEGDVPDGPWPPGAKHPFIMRPEGFACLFASALTDGPFPEHYEPLESPIRNPMSSQQINPAVKVWEPDKIGDPARYPIVATTYRVSEHWQAGAMTRNTPWLVELMPDLFVEMSTDLARRRGIRTGDWVRVETTRGEIRARALVTERFQPLVVLGKIVDQIGIPWHWGYSGLATGDSANVLTPHVGDANTMIPEYKAFLCEVHKAEGVA